MTPETWLTGYQGQSTDALIALARSHRIDSIVLAFEEALQQKQVRSGHNSLSNEERTILAVEALEREVNNGGYRQFFVNGSCEYAGTIVTALNLIGQKDVADLTLAAIHSLGHGRSPTPEKIASSLSTENEVRDRALTDLTNVYF